MDSIQSLLKNSAKASVSLRKLSDEKKKLVLELLAKRLLENVSEIVAENKKDLDQMSDTDPKKDRLMLNPQRIQDLADSVIDISRLEDPTNKILSDKVNKNGLSIQKISVPLGVVGVIYESRPNVTIDVAALCIRSGNVCVLRGGTDAFFSNTILVSLIRDVLKEFDLDSNIVTLFPADRKYIAEMLSAVKYIDIIIPRGSDQLIKYIRENSLVPVIETGAGVCHTYVEKTADLKKAADIITNAKVTRPSVCNALDTVLTDRSVAEPLLKLLAPLLKAYDVEIYADAVSYDILKSLNYSSLVRAKPEDFGREFLDFKCSIKVVENIDEALAHISEFSSKHSEAIISQDQALCDRFLTEVDAAAVFTNASTRFTDGGVF
ncbi:MAG TPA: glutamate-5-semialdehyde dehydrogenase, partial [Sphingobacteriaceae bacterium]|nr:glutamate-5-semialdehyde dehydrogenase [Sphingobacteriaceae bacterium]